MGKVNLCTVESVLKTRFIKDLAEKGGSQVFNIMEEYWTPYLRELPKLPKSTMAILENNPGPSWAIGALTEEDARDMGAISNDLTIGFATNTDEGEVVLMVFITKSTTEEMLNEIIEHELVHARQILSERLCLDGPGVKFDGVSYTPIPMAFVKCRELGEFMEAVMAYISQPWEAEAFRVSGLDSLTTPELAEVMRKHYDCTGKWLPELPVDFWSTLETGRFQNKFAAAADKISKLMK